MLAPGLVEVRCVIKSFPLLTCVYSLRLGVAVGKIYRIAFCEAVSPFHVKGKHRTRPQGSVELDTTWDIVELAAEEPLHGGRSAAAKLGNDSRALISTETSSYRSDRQSSDS